MADVTANVVVSMPSQLFTASRSFKALANGRIYVGKVDTDPSTPANQVQVYIDNESGDLVPIAQPIVINAAGFPVYNGQVAKIVTVQGHSMAVYDAYGSLEHYFPDVLKYEPDQFSRTLAAPGGLQFIGASPGGNLSQVINYVTPEQFGAIGDGTPHPLSERYNSLAAAQVVYPHVTSLTQTIDWAACQAAENYARGKYLIQCPYAIYHFGSDGLLEIGINSKWYGVTNTPLSNAFGTTMLRTKPTAKPSFGKDAVVRVIDATTAGSSDEFVRGVVFRGIHCSRGVGRRTISKYDGSIGFHANFAMKAEVDISVSGAEYGFFGYGCWGLKGTIRADSCHKAIWLDPDTPTPELTKAGGSITALDLRVEVDACVYGLILRHVQYSQICGWVEGMVANSNYPIYDSTNETAIAVTAHGCTNVDINNLGIEEWQGVHAYSNGSTVSIGIHWNQGRKLTSTTGKHGPYQSMSVLMANTELFTLPSGNNAYYYSVNYSLLKLRNITGDMSTAEFSSTYLVNVDTNSRFLTESTGIYFGSNRQIAPANWVNIESINENFMPAYLVPGGFEYEGKGICSSAAWSTKVINAGDGRVTIEAPSGWKIIDFTANVFGGSVSQARNYAPMAVVSTSDTQITLQTGIDTTGFSISYKLRLKVTK